MKVGGVRVDDCTDEELKSDTLGPADVAASIVPIRAERPGTPLTVEADSNAGG